MVDPSTPEAAALAAVLAAPEDDAPRLAYADAIAASDPARAELIRLQIANTQARRRMSTPPDGSYHREHALLTAHGTAWAADVAPLVTGRQLLRGFVELIAIDAADFLARADEIYRRAPVLHLDLTGVKAVAGELFGSPHLTRIRSLKLLNNQLGDAEATLLARSPYLPNLWWLDLAANQVGAQGLEELAASQRLPKLGYVRFERNAVADPTPKHADEYDAESAEAKRLQAAYGPRPWLDARPRPVWPPARDVPEYPPPR